MYASVATLLLVAGGWDISSSARPRRRRVGRRGGRRLDGAPRKRTSAGYAASRVALAGADTHTTSGSRSSLSCSRLRHLCSWSCCSSRLREVDALRLRRCFSIATCSTRCVHQPAWSVLAWVYATCEASWIPVFRRFTANRGAGGGSAEPQRARWPPSSGRSSAPTFDGGSSDLCDVLFLDDVCPLLRPDHERRTSGPTLRESGDSTPAWPVPSILFSVTFILAGRNDAVGRRRFS